MNLNIEVIAQMLIALGEPTVRRMLTVPGAVCNAQALKNKDEASEMIQKRNAFVDATIEFAKEFINIDGD